MPLLTEIGDGILLPAQTNSYEFILGTNLSRSKGADCSQRGEITLSAERPDLWPVTSD